MQTADFNADEMWRIDRI